jgi:hypothetical protein
MGRLASCALPLLLALAAAAHAETYKCQGPDGKMLFTSDRSKCPQASLHESSGQLQRSQGADEAPPARPRETSSHARSAFEEEAEAQVWRAKRANAQAELAQTAARLETLHQVAGWCNRGQEVWTEDADGLRHDIDCDDIEQRERTLRREHARLAAYLAEGLEEECRRAGCLPGWIR